MFFVQQQEGPLLNPSKEGCYTAINVPHDPSLLGLLEGIVQL
jgi:hypothetical protein